MLLGILGVSLLGTPFTGEGSNRGCKGTIRAGEGTVRAGQ